MGDASLWHFCYDKYRKNIAFQYPSSGMRIYWINRLTHGKNSYNAFSCKYMTNQLVQTDYFFREKYCLKIIWHSISWSLGQSVTRPKEVILPHNRQLSLSRYLSSKLKSFRRLWTVSENKNMSLYMYGTSLKKIWMRKQSIYWFF